MVTKSQKKLIRSLKAKKNRKEHGLFIAEGIKVINEFIASGFVLYKIFALKAEVHQLHTKNSSLIETINSTELEQISCLHSPQKALALFKIKEPNPPNEKEQLKLALDDIQDPGNLGTIIRLCDWFGIDHLICSHHTVDCYNPKVVQATMGSLARVCIEYVDLASYLQKANSPVLGTFMDGDNVYKTKLPQNGILIMGNEGNGISQEIERMVTQKLAIPRFGSIQKTESLNVATATAILLSEFKRNFS